MAESREYQQGFECGMEEIREDGWTADTARRYLDAVGKPCDEFDRGHQAAVRTLLTCECGSTAEPVEAFQPEHLGGAFAGLMCPDCSASRDKACASCSKPATHGSGSDTFICFAAVIDDRNDS